MPQSKGSPTVAHNLATEQQLYKITLVSMHKSHKSRLKWYILVDILDWKYAVQMKNCLLTNSYLTQVLFRILASHPIISSSVVPFSSCLLSFPASGSFQMSQLFASGGQRIGSFSFSISPPMEYSGLTGWISLQSKGLSRVSSNTTARRHQFFGAQSSSWSSSHICTWLLEKS